MIFISNKSLFNSNCSYLVNTVNTVGFMGKGLALEMALRFPELELDYKEKCKVGSIKIGSIDSFVVDKFTIVNFPTKEHYKNPSSYSFIEKGLISLKDFIQSNNINNIAIPLLGSSNGGLEKDQVINLIGHYLSSVNSNIYICLDDLEYAEGDELRMIEEFNHTNFLNLASFLRIKPATIEELNSIKGKLRRFKDLMMIEEVTKITYSKLFRYFYFNKKDSFEEVKLF